MQTLFNNIYKCKTFTLMTAKCVLKGAKSATSHSYGSVYFRSIVRGNQIKFLRTNQHIQREVKIGSLTFTTNAAYYSTEFSRHPYSA